MEGHLGNMTPQFRVEHTLVAGYPLDLAQKARALQNFTTRVYKCIEDNIFDGNVTINIYGEPIEVVKHVFDAYLEFGYTGKIDEDQAWIYLEWAK